MPKVQITVGEGRAIMKDEAGATAVFCLDLAVQINLVPVVDARGLSFDQIAPHWEAGLWQIERSFEVLGHNLAPILDRIVGKTARVWFFTSTCQAISARPLDGLTKRFWVRLISPSVGKLTS